MTSVAPSVAQIRFSPGHTSFHSVKPCELMTSVGGGLGQVKPYFSSPSMSGSNHGSRPSTWVTGTGILSYDRRHVAPPNECPARMTEDVSTLPRSASEKADACSASIPSGTTEPLSRVLNVLYACCTSCTRMRSWSTRKSISSSAPSSGHVRFVDRVKSSLGSSADAASASLPSG